jgi:PadR family transcriptional regulator, regulatory protein PadR
MKLPSGNEVEVLRLLAGGRELYGLEMIKRADGALKRNSIYVVLGRMEDQGFVKGREAKHEGTPGMPRRLYKITGLGQRVFAAWEAAQSAWDADGPKPVGA